MHSGLEILLVFRAGGGLGIGNPGTAKIDEKEGHPFRCFDPPEHWAADHLILISPEAWRPPEVEALVKFPALFSHLA